MRLRALLFSVIITVFAILGCSGGDAQMYNSALLEEKQNNIPHAVELYEELLERYPESKYSPMARKRLEALKNLPETQR